MFGSHEEKRILFVGASDWPVWGDPVVMDFFGHFHNSPDGASFFFKALGSTF